ncbi:methyltransferase type 11 [Helicobacter sp. CLO-3]|uniref:methyltransferase type 11 n=2 Tax=Helicobacter TaxID=209 RepID=UPI002108E1C2|nr:methyltransferase type 11 [Helicobacter sp. CLO-3]
MILLQISGGGGNLPESRTLESKTLNFKASDSKMLESKVPESKTLSPKIDSGVLDFKDCEKRYDWMMIEIFDQMVRMKSGGEMLECFERTREDKDVALAAYIQERVGENVLADGACAGKSGASKIAKLKSKLAKLSADKIANKILSLYLKALRAMIPKTLRDEIFINTSIGERHKWAYDSFSMSRLLGKAGYKNIKILDFKTSDITDFNQYLLDINQDGSAYKGCSSLYVECVK